MTSERAAKVLAVIDAGLQTPMPDPSFGEISPRVSDRCPRCDRRDPEDESEFCGPCRAYLLGDAPDPDDPGPVIFGYVDVESFSLCDGRAVREDYLLRGGSELDRSVARFTNAMTVTDESMEQIRESFRLFGERLAAEVSSLIERMDDVAPILMADRSGGALAAAARRYCDVRARSHHDHHAEMRVARFVFDDTVSNGAAWHIAAHEADRMLYEQTARRPRWATVWAEPTGDPLNVRLCVSWSSLDPALRPDRDGHGYPLDPNDPDYG